MPQVSPSDMNRERAVRVHWLRNACVFGSILLSGLLIMPFLPVMPAPNLDASWMYAINEVLAKGLVFGRDFIFTFGPLGPVYTGMYHPEVQGVMLWGSAVMAAGFCSGFAILASQRRSLAIMVLPLAVVESQSRDAVLMAIPLLLLLSTFVTSRKHRISRVQGTGLLIISAATGAVPLVKGSFAATSFFLLVLSIALLTRRRYGLMACGLLLSAALSLVGAWLLTGQPTMGLPRFFVAQVAIVDGYGEAMSLSGSFIPVVICLALFVGLVSIFHIYVARAHGLDGMIASLGFVAFLFVAFKASFVRQDVEIHLHISMGTLLLAALATGMLLPARIATMLWIVALLGWFVMEAQIGGLQSATLLTPLRREVGNVVQGIPIRLSHPHRLEEMFQAANADIKKMEPLPHVQGTSEIYPSELADIYANGLEWSGKPVPQSYSAYTSVLDQINADFLAGNRAPRNIFYTTSHTIDNRLPAMQDAGSVKVMFSDYSVVGRTGPYVQMIRNDHPVPVTESGVGAVDGSINQNISIPVARDPILAKIDMKKSIIGSFVAIVYKLPEINIDTVFDSGRVQRNRYIPEMGKTGFIVSPFLGNEDDFIRIAAHTPSKDRVREIRISVDNPIFWRRTIHVTFSELNNPPQAAAAGLIDR